MLRKLRDDVDVFRTAQGFLAVPVVGEVREDERVHIVGSIWTRRGHGPDEIPNVTEPCAFLDGDASDRGDVHVDKDNERHTSRVLRQRVIGETFDVPTKRLYLMHTARLSEDSRSVSAF